MSDFKPQEIANTAWAPATMDQPEETLLQDGESCRAADGTAKPQGLASMAWAFATMDHPDEKLFIALARAAERRVSDFIARNIANIAWASATLNELDEKLLTA